MSKKQKPTKKKVAKPLSGMQQIAIAVVIVGVIALAWVLLTSTKGALSGGVPTLSADAAGSGAAAPTAAGQPAAVTGSKSYSAAPPMTIDAKKQYFANFKMAKGGEFVVQLFPDKAPITVNSFVFLAKDGFYNGTTFHRVLEGFMAQGGDPTGTGGGGPGYKFVNEKNDLLFDKPGVVAMANAGPNTNGSQFFIMFGPYGLSENDYTIFGQVTSGMEVVNAITRRDPDTNPTFPGDTIESVTITEK
jgi:cyclophilin family peptidyl-prolyl cis-trans isomerase